MTDEKTARALVKKHAERKPHNPNRDNDLPTVLLRLQQHPEIVPAARVVGKWVWIEFDEIPAKEIREFLLAEGFWFNRARSAWQHGCGTYSTHARSYDPRGKYGSYRVSDLLNDPQAIAS